MSIKVLAKNTLLQKHNIPMKNYGFYFAKKSENRKYCNFIISLLLELLFLSIMI